MKPWNMVAAVSKEYGLEAAILYDEVIDSKRFVQIYEQIAKNGEDFILFGDNASWHYSKFTRKFLTDRKSDILFNLSYTPLLNCIEVVFL